MNFQTFLSWIPGWLGFLLLIIVGALMAIHGVFNPLNAALDPHNRAGFIIFGLCALAVGIFSWIAGSTSQIRGRTGTVGVLVSVENMPWWVWLVDVGIVVVAVVLYMALTR
jgi:putative Mn2+ efflux pump MntP